MKKESSIHNIGTKRNIALIFLLLILLLFIIWFAPESFSMGTGDFRPYWSASYLLVHGQDFSDLSLMDQIERALTGWDKPFTMMAWFAPTGMVVLLPFTFLPFEKAAFFWLLTNIMVLSATAFLLWSDVKRKIWIPLLAVFAFPMTLLSLYVGQINTLVLFGLAVFISLKKPEHQYFRGIGLALTTIKPHLVILTLPLIILDCIYKKQWKILIGFFGSLLVCSVILFALYPSWPIGFWNLVSSGMSTIRETPTISGLIAYTTGQEWGKWLWIPGLLTVMFLWWKRKDNLFPIEMINISLIIGLLISPIGWSYDQIMLLIPIVLLLGKNMKREFTQKKSLIVMAFLSMVYSVGIFMRVLSPNEVCFFWIPLIIGVLTLIDYKNHFGMSK
ncbi:MAG: hypothetical protein CVU40_17370 [Chloroflexi bacterium HGW-Chloroflexi-2]|jgi:hypothetical protein|nr:MAG: hypothetical protein CVU40_17370 [Chloroflexi bacterium HGW-Chloroflexi-2]